MSAYAGVVTLSHGAESNAAGRFLETMVENEARARGFHIVNYSYDMDNGDLFCEAMLIKNVPYTSIYGCKSKSEFVIQFGPRRIRIECRVQESSGSVDEKFPYLHRNARDCMPENEVILLLHGSGARIEAVRWLKRECLRTPSKKILVQDIQEFRGWFKLLTKGAV